MVERMKVTAQALVSANLGAVAADILAIPIFEDEAGGALVTVLDKALGGGVLERALAEEDVRGKRGQSLLMHTHGKVAASRVLLVGMGKRADLTEDGVRRYAGQAGRAGDKGRAKRVAVALPEHKLDAAAVLAGAAEGLHLSLYRFNRYITRDRQEQPCEEATFLCPTLPPTPEDLLTRVAKIALGVALARDLVNEPPSVLTPVQLAAHARRAADEAGLNYSELGPKELAAEKMELMLAVSRASTEEPRLVRLEYKPAGTPTHKVVLVGKGLTFDSGGLDIKTAEGMLDMKVDMSGAAAVLGAMVGVAAARPNAHVVGYLACAENMLGGRAYKPGDIIKSRAGLSVEIGNTDAEGRLVLADALSYAQERDAPDIVVDLATLTGACMVALGPYMAGLFSNHDELARGITAAGEQAGEEFWRMPMPDNLKEMLKSPIADLKNVGQRYGGAITAALFLKDFIKDGTRWAHLDIAGPATHDKERDYLPKGGTGFGSRTLVRWLAGL